MDPSKYNPNITEHISLQKNGESFSIFQFNREKDKLAHEKNTLQPPSKRIKLEIRQWVTKYLTSKDLHSSKDFGFPPRNVFSEAWACSQL